VTGSGADAPTPRLRKRLGAEHGIPRRPAGAPAPLSFAQGRIWFLENVARGVPLFNCPFAYWLTGELDVATLRRALAEIERRHEVLRTRFAEAFGDLAQVIAPQEELALPITDLGGIAAEEREARALALVQEKARLPLDMTRGPVWRCELLRLDAHQHLLVVVVHHAVFDVGSVGLLVRELAALYGAFRRGEASPLPELPVQFADYAAWDRTRLSGARLERSLAHWKQALAGRVPQIELPCDRPRPKAPTHGGAFATRAIPADVARALSALAQSEGVTMFMLLLALFKVQLARYSGQGDVLVGIPFSLRTRSELAHLIGVFMNTLVVRTELSGDPSFREVLRRVRETALDAYSHHELPFEVLVDALQPARERGPNALFQVMFDMPDEGETRFSLPGVELRAAAPWQVHTGTAKTDLNLYVSAQPNGELLAAVEYSTDLFDPPSADAVLGHYATLAASAAADPEQSISALALLTEDEHRALARWNDTAVPYPADATIPELFAAEAARRPDAVALVSGEGSMTYGELARRSRRLAQSLRALGVGPDVMVGICAYRSPELIVGILAILEAGGAYVPLDPDYPTERLRLLMEDAALPVLLLQEGAGRNLPAHGARVVPLADGAGADAPDGAPPRRGGADDLAYVMYTSGSTGRPKGVCVTHRNVVRLVRGTSFVRFDERQTLLHCSAISFDASTYEVWGALLNGGRLVLYPAGKPSLEELGAAIKEHGITSMFLTSALFGLMVEHRLDDLRGLRELLVGGEVVPVAHARRAVEGLPDTRLIAGYGPTENTTFTTVHPMASVADIGASVPIGRPIANTRVYVLDAHGRPQPPLVPGELCCGGDGVARGYLRRPELDAERFPADPFARKPGARMYRTGDIVRWRRDGVLEFLGRRDHQVKLRGFRIELGEIEVALGRHPDVEAAVVVAREDTPGDKRLVGYVVGRDGRAPGAAALREALGAKLPEYMVPAAFVVLPSLPLTSNGKVDRAALPAPEQQRPEVRTAFVSPQTEMERRIAAVWQEILRTGRIGADDNFFDLGGNSLLLVRACTKLRELLAREIAIADMFQHPTLRALAAHLGGGAAPAPADQGARRAHAEDRRAAAESLRQRKRPPPR
jgi:amino acid adenylation domain-containing protein